MNILKSEVKELLLPLEKIITFTREFYVNPLQNPVKKDLHI